MSVLLLSTEYDPEARELSQNLAAEGVEHKHVTLRIPSVRDLICRNATMESPSVAVEGSKDKLFTFSSLLNKIKEEEAHIIHAFGLWPFGACASVVKALDFKPFVLSIGNDLLNYARLKATRQLSAAAIHSASFLLVPSRALARELLKSFGKLDNVIELPPCLGLEKLLTNQKDDNMPQEPQTPRNETVFLYAGDTWYTSGIEVLLLAFRRLHEEVKRVKLIIATPGTAQGLGYIVERVGLKDSVLVDKCVDPSQIYRYYLASDVFVYPHPLDMTGRQVLEAMAFGRPVIALFYRC